MYWNRWIVFVACAFLQASAGLNYSFSVFAPALKELFHLDELQLGSVATLGFNLGGYLAVVSGAVYDALGSKNHIGPRVVSITGAVFLFCGYFGIYSLATGLLPFNYLLLVFFAFVAGNAGCWFDTAALATCIRNYPDDRGTVVGILKSFLGLTATIYTSIYVAVFQPKTIEFLLFLALCPSFLALVLSGFISIVPLEYHLDDAPSAALLRTSSCARPHTSHISKHTRFAIVYAIVAIMALGGMTTAIWSSQHQLGGLGRKIIISGLIGLLALLLLVPLSAGPCTHPRRRLRKKAGAAGAATSVTTPLLQHQQEEEEPGVKPSQDASKTADGGSGEVREPEDEDETETQPAKELRPHQAAQTLSFWIIVFQAVMGLGTGLAFLNNVTGIVIALGGNVGGQVVFVSLFSVANASGRLAFGYISEYYLHARGTPRTLFLLIISVTMTAFSVSMYFATLPDLFAMALLGGFAFGGHWAVIPSLIADLFGIKHFASTYTWVQFAPAAGGYLLGTLLVGVLYEAAKAAGPSAGQHYCIGSGCYSTTWLVLTVMNVLSVMGTRLLMHLNRDAYRRMHHAEP